MAKTKFERHLEKEPLVHLARRCDKVGVPHTGDRKALIARLVEAEPEEAGKAEPEEAGKAEPEPEVEPPATEPEKPEEEPEPETPPVEE